jgi:hypothetical protein
MKDDLGALLLDEDEREEPSVDNFLKVLIVDDEPTVHHITALVSKNFDTMAIDSNLRVPIRPPKPGKFSHLRVLLH